ncbi:MAG: peptide chain release factor 1 [Alphaproteobacteria bacterium]|nr:peptide chain release factor 1 [Alphaproteobacteria bacterium]
MNFIDKLNPIAGRHEELASLMSVSGLSGEEFTKLSMEYAELSPVVEAIVAYKTAVQEKEDLQELLADPDMKSMAQDDLVRLNKEIPALEAKIKLALIPKDVDDAKDAILEIRAGTGGDEAALFASNLFTMYKTFAAERGWSVEVLEASSSDSGGYKEIIARVTGRNVFSAMKFESGVHRVQRVPDTESQGRVHTSAATVAVLPEVDEVEVDIQTKDLRIDVYRASGSGGQHVNTTESAVRITHLPTNIVVAIQDESSQHKNKAKAMKILQARVYDAAKQKIDSERSEDRKSQVGSGDRSERIRTYNFPQGRVTDHRINLTLYKLDEIMRGGGLEEVVHALTAEDQASKLAALDG